MRCPFVCHRELQNLERVSTDELVLSLRRQSKGFTRGSSKFRGVTRHQSACFVWILRLVPARA